MFMHPMVKYADAMSRETGQGIEPTKLIPPMLKRFLASDWGFPGAQRKRPTVKLTSTHAQALPVRLILSAHGTNHRQEAAQWRVVAIRVPVGGHIVGCRCGILANCK